MMDNQVLLSIENCIDSYICVSNIYVGGRDVLQLHFTHK